MVCRHQQKGHPRVAFFYMKHSFTNLLVQERQHLRVEIHIILHRAVAVAFSFLDHERLGWISFVAKFTRHITDLGERHANIIGTGIKEYRPLDFCSVVYRRNILHKL